jgi:hypothetical protein
LRLVTDQKFGREQINLLFFVGVYTSISLAIRSAAEPSPSMWYLLDKIFITGKVKSSTSFLQHINKVGSRVDFDSSSP